jgi:cardiolipin synthase
MKALNGLKLASVPGRWRLPVTIAATLTALDHTYRARGQKYELYGELDPASESFGRAIEALTDSPYTTGNQVQLLINGDQIFPAMLEAIRSATATINFLTYVYWRGPIAQLFGEALIEKAKNGVECNLLLDAIGTEKIDHALVAQMRKAGVKVVYFRPVNWINLTRLDNRTHRKVLVVDGRVGFTGGVGIAEEWTGHAQDRQHWRDTHIKLEGPAVRGLQGAFIENWAEATGQVQVGDCYLPPIEPFEGGVCAQVTRSSAGKGATNLEALFFVALAAARKNIWLTSAYFVPRLTFLQELEAASQRGVDVKILLPGPYSNKLVTRETGRHYYARLLKAGVQLYEYQPTMLHAKTLTIDGVWSSVGSANFDNRSFALNDEVNVSVQDPGLAQALDRQFELDLKESNLITLEHWARRSGGEKLAERASNLVRREL